MVRSADIDLNGDVRSTGTDELDLAAAAVGLAPVFQPIVTLPGNTVVGFEALARWPTLRNPDPQSVFERAKATGRVDRLDQECIDRAIEHALARGLAKDTLLMVNCEPTSERTDQAGNRALALARDHLQVAFELTERSLLEHPHALLRKVAALRADGFMVALDDVGAQPDSLALLDLVHPDVIKLDLHLVQRQPDDDQARVLAAVLAHRERAGAILIAEGIESDEHLEQALSLGANLGQGYKFGRPEPLDRQSAVPWRAPPRRPPSTCDSGSPFDVVKNHSEMRTARRQTLIAFTHHVERQAWFAADPPIVLTALQRVEHYTRRTSELYRDIAATSPLVAVFGRGMPHDAGPGVRGVDLELADPLCREWTVVVLGPHHAAALVAREIEDDAPRADMDRRFEFTITYDRAVVTLVARNMLDRIP